MFEEYTKINVPIDTYCSFRYSKDNINYVIHMKYVEAFQTWFIKIEFDDFTTGYVALTATPILFASRMNTIPHCFFCKTLSGQQPSMDHSFDAQKGDATLYCDSWENVLEYLSND